MLLVALAPDLDPSFEKLYGYLNDDVTRRRASVGLALELCGASAVEGWARSRLASAAPLVSGSLVSVEDSDRPLLGRSLRVPDRVVDHLLGRDEPDPVIAHLLITPGAWPGATGFDAPECPQRWRDSFLRARTARGRPPCRTWRRVWPVLEGMSLPSTCRFLAAART